MATEKKTQASDEGAGAAVAPAPAVDELRKTIQSLQREIEALKQSRDPGQVQVERIYVETAATSVPEPVAGVIAQYAALERALLNPEPAWVFPGSTPTGTRSQAAASS